jgi:hypothetical protein
MSLFEFLLSVAIVLGVAGFLFLAEWVIDFWFSWPFEQ